jgi:hypothetical protein
LHRGHSPNDDPSSPTMDLRLLDFVLLLDALDDDDDDDEEEAKKLANDDGAVARFAFDDDDDEFPNMLLIADCSLSRLGTA